MGFSLRICKYVKSHKNEISGNKKEMEKPYSSVTSVYDDAFARSFHSMGREESNIFGFQWIFIGALR